MILLSRFIEWGASVEGVEGERTVFHYPFVDMDDGRKKKHLVVKATVIGDRVSFRGCQVNLLLNPLADIPPYWMPHMFEDSLKKFNQKIELPSEEKQGPSPEWNMLTVVKKALLDAATFYVEQKRSKNEEPDFFHFNSLANEQFSVAFKKK